MESMINVIKVNKEKTLNRIISEIIIDYSSKEGESILYFSNGASEFVFCSDMMECVANLKRVNMEKDRKVCSVPEIICELSELPIYVDSSIIKKEEDVLLETIYLKRSCEVAVVLINNFYTDRRLETEKLISTLKNLNIRTYLFEKED